MQPTIEHKEDRIGVRTSLIEYMCSKDITESLKQEIRRMYEPLPKTNRHNFNQREEEAYRQAKEFLIKHGKYRQHA